jgi:hypothetical protein
MVPAARGEVRDRIKRLNKLSPTSGTVAVPRLRIDGLACIMVSLVGSAGPILVLWPGVFL